MRSRVAWLAVAAAAAVVTPARVLIPFAAGVWLWRRAVDDKGIERSIALGSALGLGMFWIAFTVTARWLPPRPAAWVAAALTAGAAALLVRWNARARPGSPSIVNQPWFELSFGSRVFVLVAAVVVAVSTYAAAGSLSTFNETVEIHVPLVSAFQRGNWPPVDLREPPHPLEYHWGSHALATGLGLLAGSDAPDLALFTTNSVAAGLAFAITFLMVFRHAGSVGGAFAAILLVGAGTLNWLSAPRLAAGGALAPLLDPMGFPFTTGNLIVGGFFWRLHANSTSWAICTLLLAFELIALAWQNGRASLALAAALALALVAPTSETTFCAAVAALPTIALLKTAMDGTRSGRTFALGLTAAVGAAIVAPLLGGVLATFLATGSASHQAHVVLNREHFGAVPSWNFRGHFRDAAWIDILSLRFLQDAGPLPLLALPAGIVAVRRRAWPVAAAAGTAVVLLVASTAFTLTRYPANMFRLLSASVGLAGIAVGYAMAILLRRLSGRVPRRVATAMAAAATILLVAAWPLSWAGLTCCGRSFPWPRKDAGPVTDAGAVAWLRENTSFRDAVLTLPAGRSGIEASGQLHPFGRWAGGRPEYPERARAALAGPDLAALERLNIRYLYVSESEIEPAQRVAVNQAVADGRAAVVWSDAGPTRLLLRIGPDR